MAQAQVIQGTGRELVTYLTGLLERKNLTLIIPEEETSEAAPIEASGFVPKDHFYFTATPDEFNRALDEIAEMNRHLPPLPPEAFDRENLP